MEISVIKAVCSEIRGLLPGTRLSGLAEDGAGGLCLDFRAPGNKHTLFICPRPPLPRLFLSSGRPCRGKALGPFASSLKNLLAGATLEAVVSEGLERAVRFNFSRRPRASGKPEEKTTLVFELGGKKPDLIVVDEDGKVALAQSYVPVSDDAQRPLLPGLLYQPPPRPDKLDPAVLTEADAAGIIGGPGPLDRALFMAVGGVSPLVAREAAHLAGDSPDAAALLAALRALIKRVEEGPYGPRVYETPKGPVLAAFSFKHLFGFPQRRYGTASEAAEQFYLSLAHAREFGEEKNALARQARTRLASAKKKHDAISSDMKRADDADTYQLYGQLLMASISSVPARADSVSLTNLFSTEGGAVTVPLDPKLTAVQNAERYFVKARKARAGAGILAERLRASGEEVKTLTALLKKIEHTGDLEGLRSIHASHPLNNERSERRGAGKGGPPKLPSFISPDGYEVLYAKNAKASDLLTFKLAEPMDLWLHAQGYHGGHVVVKNPGRRPDIPLDTILSAASAAAYYSGARKEGSVPVDYTFKKYVRKPRDPVPGKAIFTNNKTVFVEPKKPE